jgi:hypothetical protein
VRRGEGAATIALLALAAGCGNGPIRSLGSDSTSASNPCDTPIPPPAGLGLDAFYTKYLDANGIPVLSSSKVSDLALSQACTMTVRMLSKRADVLDALRTRHLKVAVLAQKEVLTELPDYRDLYTVFPKSDWDTYRGVSATAVRPTASCGEENLLCLRSDPYLGGFVLPFTVGHSLRTLGIQPVDGTFESRLKDIYDAAMAEGLFANTYAAEDPGEMFVTGVLDWFDANQQADPPDGAHNAVNTRAELQAYAPDLSRLLSEFLPADDWRASCP